jgi:hypothetical protein
MLIACSNEDEAIMLEENGIPVVVNVTEEPIQGDNASQAPHRGSMLTTSSFTKFHIEYYFQGGDCWNKYQYNKSENTWSGNMTWPEVSTNYPLTFYAYFDQNTESVSRVNDSSDPYIVVTVENNASSQRDVIAAKSKSFQYSEIGSSVDLSFKHICSAVQFKIGKTAAMSAYNIIVLTAELCNIVKQGEYHFNAESWTFRSEKANYTLNNASFTLGTEATDLNLASGSEYLFLIPQTLTAWDKTTPISENPIGSYVHLRCKISKEGSYKIGGNETWGDAYLPVSGTWEQSKKHIFTILVGTALRNASGTQITTL